MLDTIFCLKTFSLLWYIFHVHIIHVQYIIFAHNNCLNWLNKTKQCAHTCAVNPMILGYDSAVRLSTRAHCLFSATHSCGVSYKERVCPLGPRFFPNFRNSLETLKKTSAGRLTQNAQKCTRNGLRIIKIRAKILVQTTF